MQLMLWANGPWQRGRQPSLAIRLILDLVLRASKIGRFRDVVKSPQGLPWRGGLRTGIYLGRRVVTDDGKVHLITPRLAEQTARLGQVFEDESASYVRGEMRLISKRMHSTHNSWTQNIAGLTNGEMGQTNYLYMHPEDARAKGLDEKSAADVHSRTNSIRLPVKLLDTLMPGTVAIPHGWGHQHARGLSVASKLSGANVNLLAADGPDAVEKISGMAHLSGIRVRVEPAAGPIDASSWSVRPSDAVVSATA